MPAGPGESLLITCFADVHYYFTDPASRPSHHRFDKGSYVYFFYNPATRHTKLEIANHAGTPDQDAFHGYLNVAILRHTYLHPSLCTLLVNSSAVSDQSTWHLPDDQKYMYKLHAVDLYFWTERDASNVLNQLRSVLSPDRLDIKEAPGSSSPHSEHRDSMSPVVQQLERTAIGSQFPPRATSTTSAQSFAGPPTQAFPGPPTSAAAPAPATSGYNPAAPAAPEPVTYREPTPPPPDDGTGTGLRSLQPFDGSSHSPYTGQQPGQQQGYFPGPPSQHQQQRAPSFGPMAQSTIAQSPNHAGSPGYNSNNVPPTPTAPPAYSAGVSTQSRQHSTAPTGGYSNYSYGSAQELPAGNGNGQSPYNIHQVAYRVSEAEAEAHAHAHGHGHGRPKRQSSASQNPGKASAKIQGGVEKVEGTVGRFFKNFDRMI